MSKYEVLVVELVQFVLRNCKLALGARSINLEEVLGGKDLEDGLTAGGGLATADEEANWLQTVLD